MGFFDFLKRKREPQIPADALIPWVHRRSHFALLQERLKRAEPPRDPMLVVPLNEAFALCFAVATPDGPIGVRQAQLDELELDQAGALTQCMLNLKQIVSTAGVAEGLCIWQTQHQLAGGVMLAGQMMAPQLPLKGRPVLMYPEADLAVMAGDEDEAALARMLDLAAEAFDGSKQYRSLRAVHWPSGPLPKPWLPPRGHPLRDRFATLAARTRQIEAQSWMYQPGPTRLAPLSYGPGGLIAGWMRGARVLIPTDCDRVALFDTADSRHPRLEVDLAVLRDVLAHAFEDVTPSMLAGAEAAEPDEKPLFLRNRPSLFPSARELAYLAARGDAQRPPRDVPASDLLTAWDRGEPVLVLHTDQGLRLDHPDGRRAGVELEAVRSRVSQLPPHDLLMFRSGLISAALIAAVGEEDDAAAVATALMPGSAVGPAGVTNQQLGERVEQGREQLITATLCDQMLEHLKGEPAGELTTLLMKQSFEHLDPAALFPVLRPPGYEAASRANVHGMAAGIAKGALVNVVEPRSIARPLAEGVTCELVSDGGKVMMPLNAELLGETLIQPAWRTALLNLETNCVLPLQATKTPGVFHGAWHDDYDASRVLLVPHLAAACAVKGEALIFAPTVDRAWVTGADDVEGMHVVLDAVDALLASGTTTTPYQFRQLLFARPWVLRDGKPGLWPVPEGHPLAARITALDAKLEQRRARSAAHVGSFAEAVYQAAELRERPE